MGSIQHQTVEPTKAMVIRLRSLGNRGGGGAGLDGFCSISHGHLSIFPKGHLCSRPSCWVPFEPSRGRCRTASAPRCASARGICVSGARLRAWRWRSRCCPRRWWRSRRRLVLRGGRGYLEDSILHGSWCSRNWGSRDPPLRHCTS